DERDGLSGIGLDRAVMLDFDSGGRLIAALELGDDPAGADVVVVAYDPSEGSEQWSASWSGQPGSHRQSRDQVAGLVVDPSDDAIFVLANRDAGPAWTEAVLLRFEPPATTPTLEVELNVDGDSDYDAGVALAGTPAGELVAVFRLDEAGRYDFSVAGIDRDSGAVGWQRSSSELGLGRAAVDVFVGDAAALADGSVAVVGWSETT